MNKEKIYISGQISGLTAEEYAPRFFEVARQLRAQGYDVVNPLDNGIAPSEEWREQMKADIRLLIECDAIFMLSNWELSNGATLEREIAKGLGLRIEYERPPQHRDIKRAILTAMSVPFKTIAADSRERWHVYARMIYAHHCKKKGWRHRKSPKKRNTTHRLFTITYAATIANTSLTGSSAQPPRK